MNAPAFSERTSGEKAQARLIAALREPGTGGELEIAAEEVAGAGVRRGAIFSRRTGARVGRIENFQIDFVRPGEGARRTGSPVRVEEIEEWRLVGHDDASVRYDGRKIVFDDPAMVGVDPGGAIAFEAAGEIELLLSAHPWSGIVELRVGDETREIDLYVPHTVLPHPVRLDLGAGARVTLRPTGRRKPLSGGNQCLFGGYNAKTGRMTPLRHVKRAKVRGAAFTSAFYEMLARVPEDGLLLDIGGGNRQVDDPRYVNIDYTEYGEPDLIGDATKLPLASESVDAVYSTGVFEHIVDPAAAGAEVARVLKAGGRAVIGWAFMQPIHSEGQHFYNATPWGVERAFAALRPLRFWYDTSFASLVRWGAKVSGLPGLVPAGQIEEVCAILDTWDKLIPADRKSYMAGGVWAEFEKP